eukprot:gene6602-7667_t
MSFMKASMSAGASTSSPLNGGASAFKASSGFGGVENLVLGSIALPVPKANELLVRVKAFALNRADILQRMGRYPPPPGDSEIIGLEMSGVVESVGDNSSQNKFKVGDKVYGLVGGGAYGQFCTIHANHALPIPDHLCFEKAAAVPEAWLTAYQALHLLGRFEKDQSVLIHAAASGVGTALIQLAKVGGASTIIGTAGSDDKTAFIKEMGCTHAINYKTTPAFGEEVSTITNHKGVTHVFDYVGANYWNDNIKSLSMDGTMIIQGLLSGANVKENANIGGILQKRLTIKGSTLRNRSNEYKTDLISQFDRACTPLFASGLLKPVIDKVFDVDQIQEAHQYLESNANKGKVVVRGFAE